MQNGCPECEKLNKMTTDTLRLLRFPLELCLDCELEQAKATALQANNAVKEVEKRIIIATAHEIKQKIAKENNEKEKNNS